MRHLRFQGYVAGIAALLLAVGGALTLDAGTYRIDGSLGIATSGVVLRGAGAGEGGTVLVATGTSRRALIVVAGSGDRRRDPTSAVTIGYVPVGAPMTAQSRRAKPSPRGEP